VTLHFTVFDLNEVEVTLMFAEIYRLSCLEMVALD